MDFTGQLITYYKGERLEAALLAILGVVMFGVAAYVWQGTGQNPMLKGMFYPIAFLAVFTCCAGGFGIYNNDRRLQQFPKRYAVNQQGFIQAEMERFEGSNGVNKWWMPLKITWALLVLTGIAFSFFIKSEFVNGIAIGLILIGAFGFIIDGFAQQRAKVYTAVLLEE